MSSLEYILSDAAFVFAGAAATYAVISWHDRNVKRTRLREAEAIVSHARAEGERIQSEARATGAAEALRLREEIEQSFAARRADRAELERRLSEREVLLNSQLEQILDSEKTLQKQKEDLQQRQEALREKDRELAAQLQEQRQRLQQTAGLTETAARQLLLKQVEQECLREANDLSRRLIEDAKTRAEEKARQIISIAIQRYAGEHTFQNTTAAIALQGDDIKGRIIGREGRNIRAFEAATGVTVLIDDTPGAVLLSGFDPVRREIARETMMRLIQDGRIHPTRIEEVAAQVSAEMEETIVRLGEEAVRRAGLQAMAPEIVKLLGRLHFRHSYSQNILDHSVEVAQLMGLIAAELGLDITIAKRVGLLHDIGKAVNHEVEGPHAVVGAEIIKRHGESETVVNAVASHHNDVAPIGPWGLLLSAADAISASRPGARSESMTTYMKRVEDLERTAATFPGVEKAFAVQAGRELRVFVQPEAVDDEAAYALARSLVSKIEANLQYPGQIKVVVIRETRCVEVAK